MPAQPPFCSQCGSVRTEAPACPKCGTTPAVAGGGGAGGATSRRVVVAGAFAAGLSTGLGTWAALGGSSAPAAPADWRTDWLSGADGLKKAEEQGRRQNMPALVYFYTDWCGYCRRLDNNVLATEQAQKLLKKVPKVRINPELGSAESGAAQQFGVRGYPSLFLVEGEGEVKKIRAPQTVVELEQLVDKIANG